MSNKQVQQLADKLANKHNEAWKAQRERLESFYYDTSKFFRTIINEMDGDLLLLKEMGIDIDVQKMLGKVFHNFVELYKNIDPEHPYAGIQNIIEWASSKENTILFDNLNFLFNEYLRQNKVEFEQSPNLKHPRVNSIKKLTNALPALKEFMVNHPMLPDPRKISTLPPPIQNEVQTVRLGPDDKTKVHSVIPMAEEAGE